MRFGFLTACLRETPLPELVAWTHAAGFDCLELACWPLRSPAAPGQFYSGSTIDVVNLTPDGAAQIDALFSQHGLAISCLTYCDNSLAADPTVRAQKVGHLLKVIDAAALLGVSVVSCFIGRDHTKTTKDNIPVAVEVFTPLLNYAGERGVRLALENWPGIGWQIEGVPGNLCYSPALWDALFEALPFDNFGLNFDPSHLVFQGIDHLQAVRDYASRIFHVHAKDTEIHETTLARIGNLIPRSYGSWWRYRMPGWGRVDWRLFLATLRDIGYDDVVSTEHEDPEYLATEALVKEGLVLGRDHLHAALK